MTQLSEEEKIGIGVALNEGRLLGVEVDVVQRGAAFTIAVLTLPPEGPMPEDSRVWIALHPVGRVLASLREGAWNDTTAPAVPFAVQDLWG